MCGIAGIVTIKTNGCSPANGIEKMTSAMRHRGPDDEGYVLFRRGAPSLFYGDDTALPVENDLIRTQFAGAIKESGDYTADIALGHRRLSIIDLSFLGHQPMSYGDRYWIVHNGEIYNYIEIRAELENLDYSFVSHTDTEVILAAYDRWGYECLNHFNGMWAFAIYDTKEGTLFLARDRFGIKPLYYYTDNKNFLFASEIKAILAHPEVQTTPNLHYCRKYLTTGPMEYIEETAFTDIYRIPNASFVILDVTNLPQKKLKTTIFWECKPNLSYERCSQSTMKKYAKTYYDLLSDSVRIRLRADVKIAATLSGGLDSSTITYMVNQHLRQENAAEKQETFSNVYKSDGVQYCDESQYIDELAQWLNVHSNQIEPRLSEIKDEYRKMIYAMENPPTGPHMGGWYTFKCVLQKKIKINLDGQGADEQLAGYFIYLYNYFVHLPLRRLWPEFKAFGRLQNISKTKLAFCATVNILRRIFTKAIVKKMFHYLRLKKGVSLLTSANQALYNDTVSLMLTNLLHFGDSQSMAHSVESRVPFMDYRLVEFLVSLPVTYKIHNGWTKYIARLAMDKKLPDRITWRKDKMGWPDPTGYWFRGPLKEWLCQEVETCELLKKLDLNSNIRQRINSKEPIVNCIRLLNLSIWYKEFFQ